MHINRNQYIYLTRRVEMNSYMSNPNAHQQHTDGIKTRSYVCIYRLIGSTIYCNECAIELAFAYIHY